MPALDAASVSLPRQTGLCLLTHLGDFDEAPRGLGYARFDINRVLERYSFSFQIQTQSFVTYSD